MHGKLDPVTVHVPTAVSFLLTLVFPISAPFFIKMGLCERLSSRSTGAVFCANGLMFLP
jgi:hypothetical protein